MNTRPAIVAGTFYDANPEKIRTQINPWLDKPSSQIDAIRAMIVPHAGYVYSGFTAACAYRQLLSCKSSYNKVIVVGPSHHVGFVGLALPSVESFSSPLGDIPLDQSAIGSLLEQDSTLISDEIHAPEHSLEVQFPFLQSCLDEFSLIPIITGKIEPETLADHLEPIWDKDTLLVISSDLSHFHTYDEAQRVDGQTCQLIEAHTPSLTPQQACGCTGINALSALMQRGHYQLQQMKYQNSAHFSGNKDSVVGYVSYVASTVQ